MRLPPPPAAAAAAVLATFGAVLVGVGVTRPGPPAVRADTLWVPAAAMVPAPPSAGASLPPARPAADVALPVGLEIPAIGLRATVGAVGRDADGAIAVPAPGPGSGGRAYWYRDLARPGADGPAVIVGHVDSRTGGPAVFYRLGELAPGDAVTVRRADGTSVRFVVQALGRYPKSAFPAQSVYGDTPMPTLRLITCGGGFDRGSYVDNLVVFAAPAG